MAQHSSNPGGGFDPQRSINELGDLLQGIGRTIEEGINRIGTRVNVITVRVDDKAIEAIDALISAGVFKTRSEAAAYLIDEGIAAKASVFEEVNATARRINELRDQMKDILRQGVGRRASSGTASRGAPASAHVPSGGHPSSTSDINPGETRPAGEPFDD
ncbi:MAG: ribbon-helix-helix domain-containing protein [Chloroflexota bacterium]|nr:ribbon-helix-helix domain-containing protein [Dehalococcoidia bacterium]MDW8254918.1 ribbon-helix-helix domain-containing protein [Chloroflexota bacterium]